MYACSCRVVTSGAVQEAIEAGAMSVDDIARQCGAGAHCGGCWPTLMELLEGTSSAPRLLADAS